VSLEDDAIEALKARFPEAFQGTGEHAGAKWAYVKREFVVPALTMLKNELACEMLMDLTAVDYLGKETPERFCIVYQLFSLSKNQYFRLKAWVPENDPQIDSIWSLWKAAPWAEREVWDLYGITFRGNPDLRRIMLPFDYNGHPLRKDYPLIGRGERQNFPRYVK